MSYSKHAFILVSALSFPLTSFGLATQASAQEQASAPTACLADDCNFASLAASQAAADGLKLVTVPSDHIEEYLLPATGANGLPSVIQGVWWLNSTQTLGDMLLTLHDATWDAATRTASVKVYGANAYSFRATDQGLGAYFGVEISHLVYLIQFSADFHNASIVPRVEIFNQNVVVPSSVANFTMHLAEDGHWVRDSSVAGIEIPSYDLRRIVRADGTRDAAYAEYLQTVTPESFILAQAP